MYLAHFLQPQGVDFGVWQQPCPSAGAISRSDTTKMIFITQNRSSHRIPNAVDNRTYGMIRKIYGISVTVEIASSWSSRGIVSSLADSFTSSTFPFSEISRTSHLNRIQSLGRANVVLPSPFDSTRAGSSRGSCMTIQPAYCATVATCRPFQIHNSWLKNPARTKPEIRPITRKPLPASTTTGEGWSAGSVPPEGSQWMRGPIRLEGESIGVGNGRFAEGRDGLSAGGYWEHWGYFWRIELAAFRALPTFTFLKPLL